MKRIVSSQLWDRGIFRGKGRQALYLFEGVGGITDEEEEVRKPLEINVHENVIVSEFVGAARFYKKHFKVLLLVIVIMIVSPVAGYYLGGVLGAIIGSICNIAVFLLSHRATEELLNLVKYK